MVHDSLNRKPRHCYTHIHVFPVQTNTPYLIDKTIQSFKHDCTCLYIKRYVVYTSVYLNFEKQILLRRVSVFSITFNPFLYNYDVRSRNKNTSYLYKSKMRREKKNKIMPKHVCPYANKAGLFWSSRKRIPGLGSFL